MTPERIEQLRKRYDRWSMGGARDAVIVECLDEIERLRELLPPSDDSEPVTAEWSKAAGLDGHHAVEDGSRFYVMVFPWGAVDLFHEPPRGAKGMKGCDVCRMPPIKTRGDARRLAAVFGVKLREGEE